MSEIYWNEEEQVRISEAVDECVASLVREEGEKQYRKDALEALQDKVPIKPVLFNALVNERFSGKSTKTLEKHEDIVAMNEILMNNTRKTVSS